MLMNETQKKDSTTKLLQNKTIKGVKQLYDKIHKLLTLRYEDSSKNKIKREENNTQTINDELNKLKSQLSSKISDNYDKLISDYNTSGNRRKILSVLNYKTQFEKKLDVLYVNYNEEMNKHTTMYKKIENKIDVLED